MRSIGFEDVTFKAIPHPPFVGGHEEIDRKRAHHDNERNSCDFRVIAAFDERSDRTRSNLISGEDEHEPDHERSEGLQLEMTVGMLFIGRTRGEADTDETDHITRRIEDRMDAIGLHCGRIRDGSVNELRKRHRKIEQEHRKQHTPHGARSLFMILQAQMRHNAPR